MARSDQSKIEREEKLSTEPQEAQGQSATTVARARKSQGPDDDRESEVRTMNDEGNNVSKKLFEDFSDMTNTLFNPENTRKIAKLWIENSERAAEEVLKFQASATEWSKNTMFAPVFEMQNSISRSFVEISAKTARRLWQLE
jgi:hypothetical protein